MIQVENLTLKAGAFRLENLSFEIPRGEYAVLMGRTGCGKTTLLEGLCGLKSVVSGKIIIGGEEVTNAKPGMRDIGFVPQEAALFPNLKVHEQLSFALEIRKWSKEQTKCRVDELAEVLGLKQLLDRYPTGLSGGERQRISLGRALAFHPDVLCLDEPLSALDEQTRLEMYSVLQTVKQHFHTTTLHITHSMEEAVQLADVLYRLESGSLKRQEHPAPAEATGDQAKESQA
ncbi:Sulfate/thiosulfate import ATP-binding protein CysA [Polystyrenella longa]|uniref:Sulfate/thiosulfate import ATP-binding protein CysA n=1 Tax=Polystyrenella longa TaxID=2528007 RepID=A0A518CPE4_9PLAN|nr:ABC transporter ATP-binding protein [Polystyrenella longa]QDU81107.1 Sulfate/thiosulfate import ATP-binding protein CysA [Polystyrenella longa]